MEYHSLKCRQSEYISHTEVKELGVSMIGGVQTEHLITPDHQTNRPILDILGSYTGTGNDGNMSHCYETASLL